MNKVLILGVAAVQMDAIKYLKEKGYIVYAIAKSNDGPGSIHADYFKEIDILDLNAVKDYLKKHEINIVYSVGSDLAMPVISELSESLGLPHFVSKQTALICNNKNEMRKKLGNDFIGNVKHQIVEDENEPLKLDCPVIVKPADSQGQRGITLLQDTQDYKDAIKNAMNFSRSGIAMVEQFVSGYEISVNGYMVNGKLVYMAISDRVTWSEYTGLIHKHVLPSKLTNYKTEESVKSLLERASQKINIKNGPVYAQMKVEEELPYIIEITPRLDGCHMWKVIDKSAGVNLLDLTFEHLIHNDTTQINQMDIKEIVPHTLEFICQSPNTAASYENTKHTSKSFIDGFNYYQEGDLVRSINGKYEKIGYVIYDE